MYFLGRIAAQLAGLTALWIALGATGCHGNSHPDAPNSPRNPLTIIAIDISGSTTNMREQQQAFVTAAYARAGHYGEDLCVYTVDTKTACVQPPAKIGGDQGPSDSVLKAIATASKARSTGTRPALFWEQAANDIEVAGDDRPIRLLYMSDGDNDEPGDQSRIDTATAELSKHARVYVGVFGLNKDNYATINKQLAAFAKGRLVLTVGTDQATMMKGFDDVRRLSEGVQ